MIAQLTRADLAASQEALGPEKVAAIMAAINAHGTAREQARRTFPGRDAAQRDFVRGYEDETGHGDGGPFRGTPAERAGRLAAIRTFGLDREEACQRLQLALAAPLRSAERQHDASDCPLFRAVDEPRLF